MSTQQTPFNIKPAEEAAPRRFGLFRRSRLTRIALYLPILALVFVFTLRRVEHFLTYHPTGYKPGPEWTLPPNGEELWINVAGNQRINAWFLNATTKQPATGTILYFHGNGGNLTNVAWIGAELAKQGFDVLLMDYRGYGRSDGEAKDESSLDADGDAAYDYLVKQRGVKPEKLALYGSSLGTTMAIDVASRRACGALVVESGLSSAGDMGEHSLPMLPRWLHFLGVNRFESSRKIALVKCPVLIAHGTNDATIPVAQGRKLYAAANDPKRLLLVEGGTHNLAGEGGKAYLSQIASFIGKATGK
jgi:fermentation-respiration switch protein FrsA (DUF1100 family)